MFERVVCRVYWGWVIYGRKDDLGQSRNESRGEDDRFPFSLLMICTRDAIFSLPFSPFATSLRRSRVQKSIGMPYTPSLLSLTVYPNDNVSIFVFSNGGRF